MNDALHLASFLGSQLRNLHRLPLPEFCESYRLSVKNDSLQVAHSESNIPVAWELIIMTLNRRRRDVRKRLHVW